MSRKHYSTRWDEENCKPQCKACNVFRYGEQFKFGIALDKEYGAGKADELHAKSRETVKFSNPELLEMIEYYKQKTAEINK